MYDLKMEANLSVWKIIKKKKLKEVHTEEEKGRVTEREKGKKNSQVINLTGVLSHQRSPSASQLPNVTFEKTVAVECVAMAWPTFQPLEK